MTKAYDRYARACDREASPWGPIRGMLVFLLFPAGASAQVCDSYPPARPWLGVGTYHCQGGICRVWGAAAVASTTPSEHQARIRADVQRSARPAYDFSVEPSLWDIDPNGPGHGVLRDGDVLVAVNGYSVVSSMGTDELARLEVDTPVTLTVRRRERVLDVEVVPRWTCRGARVSAGRGSTPLALGPRLRRGRESYRVESGGGVRGASDRSSGVAGRRNEESPSAAPSGHGTLGLAIGCSACRRSVDLGSGVVRWSFEQYPVIVSVVASGPADVAGLRIGDVLIQIDGLDLMSDGGGERLGRIEGGDTIELRYRRGDTPGRVSVTAEAVRER